MEEASDELAFSPEQVEALALEIVGTVLDGKLYDDHQVQGWIDEICSRITKDLVDMNKPYKYIVSCVIMQKNGAGLHTATSCFWDGSNDNTATVRWPGEKKKDAVIQCICTVYGVAH